MKDSSQALILMAKAPRPGTVKTRLCPPLSHRAAASLYSCLLGDVAEEMGSRLRRVRRYLFFSPPDGGRHFRSGHFRLFEPVPQRGKDLGARMDHAIRSALENGARRVVVIGADCPFLAAGRVRSAFRELDGAVDIVLGPSEDGGFHLIGVSFPVPFLFRGVAWGTGSVLGEVTLRCRRAGLSYLFLPPEFDVDRPEDLGKLRRTSAARGSPPCPRTRRWITCL